MPDAVGQGDVEPSASSGGAAPLIAIVGPTGTGKSDLALDLAGRLRGEIVNTDALQFYRGMDIGTAKLSVAERRGIPHHLLDILDVTEEASVARFQAEVRDVIADIEARGLRPILVGGSGLYVRAALDVLEFPPTDPQVRARWEAHADAVGPDVLRAELREVDPESAERLGDVRRMVRALEVHELTGRAFTSFMPRREYLRPTVQIGLDLDRAELHARLRARVEHMVEAGLLDEVARLDAAGLREGKTAARAIGYAQFLKVLDGEWSVEDAVEDTTVATRKFARRQITWFRGDPRVTWLDPTEPDLLSRARRVPGVAGCVRPPPSASCGYEICEKFRRLHAGCPWDRLECHHDRAHLPGRRDRPCGTAWRRGRDSGSVDRPRGEAHGAGRATPRSEGPRCGSSDRLDRNGSSSASFRRRSCPARRRFDGERRVAT
jgi:tRNA dimethylallyltransferase